MPRRLRDRVECGSDLQGAWRIWRGAATGTARSEPTEASRTTASPSSWRSRSHAASYSAPSLSAAAAARRRRRQWRRRDAVLRAPMLRAVKGGAVRRAAQSRRMRQRLATLPAAQSAARRKDVGMKEVAKRSMAAEVTRPRMPLRNGDIDSQKWPSCTNVAAQRKRVADDMDAYSWMMIIARRARFVALQTAVANRAIPSNQSQKTLSATRCQGGLIAR